MEKKTLEQLRISGLITLLKYGINAKTEARILNTYGESGLRKMERIEAYVKEYGIIKALSKLEDKLEYTESKVI